MKQNNWFDPFYIQSHLSEDELRIQENVREFCEKELKPNVIEMNRKNQFNIDLYPKFGDLQLVRVYVFQPLQIPLHQEH